MEQSDFDKLKKEVGQYLENVVTPIVNYDYKRYATKIAPVLYDLRHAVFMCERDKVMNEFLKLKKIIETNEPAEKES